MSVQAKEMETQVESTDSFKILKYVSIDKLLRSTMNIGFLVWRTKELQDVLTER